MKKSGKESGSIKDKKESNSFVKALEEFMYRKLGFASTWNWLDYHNDALLLKNAIMNLDIDKMRDAVATIIDNLKHESRKDYYLQRALDLDISLAYCAKEGFLEGLKFLNELSPGYLLHSRSSISGVPDFFCRTGVLATSGNLLDAQESLEFPDSYECAQIKGHQNCVKYIEQQEDCSKYQEHCGVFKLFNGFQMTELDWVGVSQKHVSFLCLSNKHSIIEELLLIYWGLSESFDLKDLVSEKVSQYVGTTPSNKNVEKIKSSESFFVDYFLEKLNLDECSKEISKIILRSLVSSTEQNKYMLDVDVAYMADIKRAQFQSLTSSLSAQQVQLLNVLVSTLSEKQENLVKKINKGFFYNDFEQVIEETFTETLNEVEKGNEEHKELIQELEQILFSCASFFVKSAKFRSNLGANTVSKEEKCKIIESYNFLKNYNEFGSLEFASEKSETSKVNVGNLIERLLNNLIIEDWNLYYLSKLEERLKVFSTGCAVLLDKDPQLVIELWQWYQQTQSSALPAELIGALDFGCLPEVWKKVGSERDFEIRQALRVLKRPLSKGSTLGAIVFRGLRNKNSSFDFWTQQWLAESAVSEVVSGRSVTLMQSIEFFENPKAMWKNIYKKRLLDWSQRSFVWYKEQINSGVQGQTMLKMKSTPKEISFVVPDYQKTCVMLAQKIINSTNSNYPIKMKLFDGFDFLLNNVLKIENELKRERFLVKKNKTVSVKAGNVLWQAPLAKGTSDEQQSKQVRDILSSLPRRSIEHFVNGGNGANFCLTEEELELLVENSFVNGVKMNCVSNSKQKSAYTEFVSLLQSAKLEKELNGHQKYIKKQRRRSNYGISREVVENVSQKSNSSSNDSKIVPMQQLVEVAEVSDVVQVRRVSRL